MIVEIKPKFKVASYAPTFDAAALLLEATGESFVTIDEENIGNVRAERANYLKRLSEFELTADRKQAFAKHFQQGPCSVMQAVAEGFTRSEIDVAIATSIIGMAPDLGARHDSQLSSFEYARDRWSFWDWFDTEPWPELAAMGRLGKTS